MKDAVALSVIVPVTTEVDAVADVYSAYKAVLESTNQTFEMIYIVDGNLPDTLNKLRILKNAGEDLEIFCFEQQQGEAAALNVGFQKIRGNTVLTLGASHEIMVEDIAKVLDALGSADMVVASRMRPNDSGEAVREGKLERTLRFLLGSSFKDIRCGVRAMTAAVAKELTIYGNHQRFLPLVAQTQGFSVREIEVRSSAKRAKSRNMIKLDISIMLDVVTIYFLIKFTKKPFRFFGGFGFAILLLGAIITLHLVFARVFLDASLIDRPALILSSLMIVLGIQIISVGLIGEIIAFSYAKDSKDYKIDRIVE